MHIYINNKFHARKNARISVFEHGLLYGDGIFETMKAYDGNVFKIDEHVDRLFKSARLIKLKIPSSKQELKKAICMAIKKNRLKNSYIRLTVTRGTGDTGYTSKSDPNVIIIAKSLAPYPRSIYEKGVSAITYEAERFLPEAKSTSCLCLVLAKKEAEKKKCFEALLVDDKGLVREGTFSNVFFAGKKNIFTPRGNILEGVTRNTIMKIAKPAMEVRETQIKKKDIHSFDECFLTSTFAEIVPVVKINKRKIGDGHPGPITKRLMHEFKKYASGENAEGNQMRKIQA